jgi:hypothetical protein
MRCPGLTMHKLPLLRNKLQMNYTNNSSVENLYSNPPEAEDIKFYQWFVGFADGESNFSIGVDTRDKFTRFNFSFRIGLFTKLRIINL